MRRFFQRVLNAFRDERADADAAREIAAHLALLEDEYRRRGMSADEARLAARRAMGSVALAKDLHRDARSWPWIEDAAGDLRVAMRMLMAAPGFAAVVVLTMALSIGATTTLFSLSYGVLMRPMPWPDADRVVRVFETRGGKTPRVPWTTSNGTYLAWAEHPATIEEIGGWFRNTPMTMTIAGESERLPVAPITPSLLRVLRARPQIGRLFIDSDAQSPGQASQALISWGIWQRRFGGRVDAVGTRVRLNDRDFTIAGVMPRDFAFPNTETAAWTPFSVMTVQGENNTIRLSIFSAMARLKPGVTLEQASSEGTARGRAAPDLKQTAVALFGNNGPVTVSVLPALDVLTSEVRPALMILLAAVGLLFAASTASLIVLQLSRVARRRREIALRTAIGAGSARLLRQWIVESTLFGSLGAVSGLAVAMLLHRGLPAVLPAGFPRIDDVRLDWRVAAFACATALVVSVACGVVPALGARRTDLLDGLGEGPATSPAVTRTPAARVRTVLMAGQVAVACILLVGASLLTRSFAALLDTDRGFDPHGVLTMRVPLPPQSSFAKSLSLLDRLKTRLGALPGVTDVAFGNALPFVTPGLYSGMDLYLPRDPSTKVQVQTIMRAVTPEYFRAMRLRVRGGRSIANSDTESSPPVIVVNRTFAARYLGEGAVGQRLTIRGDRPPFEIVGVVDDMRQGNTTTNEAATFGGLLDPPQAEIFFSHRQWLYNIDEIIVVIRSEGDPAALSSDARAVIRAEDPSRPVDSIMTMDARVAGSLANSRSYAVFLTGFALCALAIAGVGLFGVLSYTTAQRTREIGLRTALGAQRSDVLALVGRQAVTMTLGGLAAGLVAAFFLSRTLSSLLYGVSVRDAISFATVPLVLLLVAVLACAVPAWRASRIDPIDALRAS